jgi:tetratricopeptide (TPR) repeat protein
LRQLGRPNEARERIEKARGRLKELRFNPEDVELGSEMEETLRALADNEAASGNLTYAIEIYQKLLKQIGSPETAEKFDVEDSVRLSTICDAAAALYSRAGQRELAARLAARRQELWRHWDQKLPNNSFVQRQLAAKTSLRLNQGVKLD